MALRIIANLNYYPTIRLRLYIYIHSGFVETGANTIWGAHYMKKNTKFRIQNLVRK
jgi:hypothetical protein